MFSTLHLKVLRGAKRQAGQMIAVAITVLCGIAMYVTMRGAYAGMVGAQQAYYEDYRFAHVFAHAKRAPLAVAARLREISGVAAVEPRLVFSATLDVPGLNEPAGARLVTLPDQLNRLHLRAGHLPGPGEVVISESFAVANALHPGDSLRAILNGAWTRLTIAAIAISPEFIYEIQPGGIFPDNRRYGILWLPAEELAHAFEMQGAFNDVTLRLAPQASEKQVLTRVDAILARYGGLDAYGRDDQLSHRFISNELREIRTSATLTPTIFLLIAAFLTHMMLSRLVAMERDQIAVLKAFGYSNAALFVHYFEIALLPITVGAAAGTGVGYWLAGLLAALYGRYFRFPDLTAHTEARLLAEALGIAVFAAILGVFGAVRRVVNLPPAEAMRPPAPAAFHAGLVERLGLTRFLPLTLRMILRNLERRPFRALLTLVAMGLALAVLLIGRFLNDTVVYLAHFQFELVQREQATVQFVEARPRRVLYDLRHLPGVRRAEPFRAVDARLVNGHRMYRAGILGLTPDSELRLLLDRDARRVALPAEGVLLTAKLAEILGLRPGDLVRVEVLEGLRPVRAVPVSGVVDDLIGLSAYMQLDTLNRLLRDGSPVTGGYLAVDPVSSDELYATLKRTPAVGAVVVREAMLASFRKTFAESMGISTSFLLGFAIVIAFSILYNGVRIALSERSHELASLRVLGFTRVEIGTILLGEQWLLLLLSIPCGVLMGQGLCHVLTYGMESDLFRLPVIITSRSYLIACTLIAASAVLSSALVLRGVWHLNMIDALKTRE